MNMNITQEIINREPDFSTKYTDSQKIVEIRRRMKDKCNILHHPSRPGSTGRMDLYESCLIFNGNPSRPFNFLADLCFTEQMTYG